MSSPSFVGIAVNRTYLCVSFANGLYVTKYIECQLSSFDSLEDRVIDVIGGYVGHKERQGRRVKLVAAGVSSKERTFDLCARLWFDFDIVPFVVRWKDLHFNAPEQAYKNALKVDKYFNAQVRTEGKVPQSAYLHCIPSLGYQYEVKVDFERVFLARLEDYRKTVPSDNHWWQVMRLAREFREAHLSVSFINATPQGGGVALMRHGLLRFFRLLEVQAHWHVVKPSHKVFGITKRKFHNVLQGVAPPDVMLTDADMDKFTRWSAKNARCLENVFRTSAVIVLDDPQVVGLIPHIKQINPSAKVIFRSHIQIRSDLVATAGSAQERTWKFLWSHIQHADLFVSHPIRAFVPDSVPAKKVVMMPPSTDPLDGLNKVLRQADEELYLYTFNEHVARAMQPPLDLSRPYVLQIARFDPSKGILDAMEAYRRLWDRLAAVGHSPRPQLVLTGHGSIDDPDTGPILAQVIQTRGSASFAHLKDDIKAVVLPAKDQILNALMRRAHVAFQLSHREGFEVKVTEALHKGTPLIAYEAGGIPLQVDHLRNGFLVPVGNVAQVSDLAYRLFTEPDLHKQISAKARETYNREYFTVANARNWLYLCTRLHDGRKVAGHFSNVVDLVNSEFPLRSCVPLNGECRSL